MSRDTFGTLLTKYVVGFASALVLSLLSYILVVGHSFHSASALFGVIMVLAVIQLAVQLVCFLHVGFNKRASLRSGVLLFTLMMMLVIVLGSIWIMKNLDYRMGMSGDAMNVYMEAQNKKGF